MKLDNLVKQATWYNPYIAICTNGKSYELENILIYNENGVLFETKHGWFGSNNDIGDMIIDDISYRQKVDFNRKENFVVKTNNKYSSENRYDLYIHLSDSHLNIRFKGFELNKTYLQSNYEIGITENGYKFDDVLGMTNKLSTEIKYCDMVDTYFKQLDSYTCFYHHDDFEKAIKYINGVYKKYVKMLESEKNYTLKDDWFRCINSESNSVEKIRAIEKTFNIKIDE